MKSEGKPRNVPTAKANTRRSALPLALYIPPFCHPKLPPLPFPLLVPSAANSPFSPRVSASAAGTNSLPSRPLNGINSLISSLLLLFLSHFVRPSSFSLLRDSPVLCSLSLSLSLSLLSLSPLSLFSRHRREKGGGREGAMYARNRILPGASADCTLQCYRYSTEFAVIFRMKISCTAYYNAMKY